MAERLLDRVMANSYGRNGGGTPDRNWIFQDQSTPTSKSQPAAPTIGSILEAGIDEERAIQANVGGGIVFDSSNLPMTGKRNGRVGRIKKLETRAGSKEGTCPSCSGSGNSKINCLTCRGTGQRMAQNAYGEHPITCPSCNGSTKQRCDSCRGTGKVK